MSFKSFLFLVLLTGLFLLSKIIFAQSNIVINEIAWMGTINSSNDEWIELFNSSNSQIDLEGWTLEALDGSPKINLEGKINAQDYFLLERTDDESVPGKTADQIYSGALSNSGEVLFLKDENGDMIDKVDLGEIWGGFGDAKERSTMERLSSGGWQTSVRIEGTPRVKNSQLESNVSDSDNLTFSDNQEIDDDIQERAEIKGYDYLETIVISEIFASPFNGYSDLEFVELYNYGENDVNLKGWILEDLAGMRYEIGNQNLGIKSQEESKIEAGGFFVVYREESGIALNDGGDTVRVYQPFLNEMLISLEYFKGKKGESYSLVDFDNEKLELGLLEYAWSQHLTPNDFNFFEKKNNLPEISVNFPGEGEIGVPIIFDASDTFDLDGEALEFFWDFGDGFTNSLVAPEHTFFESGEFNVVLSVFDGEDKSVKEQKINIINLSKDTRNKTQDTNNIQYSITNNQLETSDSDEVGLVPRSFSEVGEIGNNVVFIGVVAVLPGILGAQFFYCVEPGSANGIQIYSYKKDFPEHLRVGDLVEVKGEVVETKGEKRIKIKSKDDIQLIGENYDVAPKEMMVKEVGELEIGNLLMVVGEVTEKKSSYAYIDDGSDEIKIYFKTTANVSPKTLEEGREYKVTGVLSETSSGLRLMPRGKEDVVLVDVEVIEDEIQVLGTSSEDFSEINLESMPEWEIDKRDSHLDVYRYLVVGLGATCLILVVLLFRLKS